MNCVHERAKIEKAYAQQLTDWSKRWKQLVEKGPQYGSLERAWMAVMTEAEKVSELHQEVKNGLLSEDFEKIKNWQKDSYHKQMMGGFKETKEAEDGFRKAQKPWAKKLKEMETAKKVYHLACKEEKLAATREANSKAEASVTPDQQKKLQDKVDKCKQDVQKAKEKYEKALDELNKSTPQYMESMEQVFDPCQQFEEKRLSFLKEVLLDIKRHLNLTENQSVSSYDRSQVFSAEWSDEDTPNTGSETNGGANPFEEETAAPAGKGVRVRALYDYDGQEQDELSFKAGDELLKLGEEDEQGWCKGRLGNGQDGLFPANYTALLHALASSDGVTVHNTDNIQLLLGGGADVEAVTRDGETALSSLVFLVKEALDCSREDAAQIGSFCLGAARLLLAHGADPSRCSDEEPPLTCACLELFDLHFPLAVLLLQSGAGFRCSQHSPPCWWGYSLIFQRLCSGLRDRRDDCAAASELLQQAESILELAAAASPAVRLQPGFEVSTEGCGAHAEKVLDLYRHLQELEQNPVPLKQLCRAHIRHRLLPGPLEGKLVFSFVTNAIKMDSLPRLIR
ncbi:Protein kinase C and casein kinase substrate in neurons protein 1 [Acipenser ruthenus]|uniref:Protein kinase C and casein kinase substrate in neurons protein 1 n=1 Tax=Acipenser ruthenus TaxID=7906 RepID=A0A444U8V2_ACIRT|nr:Protein kinase C and casein kinase substrate in neurons protein 1 [Acipenser ruthenus]